MTGEGRGDDGRDVVPDEREIRADVVEDESALAIFDPENGDAFVRSSTTVADVVDDVETVDAR